MQRARHSCSDAQPSDLSSFPNSVASSGILRLENTAKSSLVAKVHCVQYEYQCALHTTHTHTLCTALWACQCTLHLHVRLPLQILSFLLDSTILTNGLLFQRCSSQRLTTCRAGCKGWQAHGMQSDARCNPWACHMLPTDFCCFLRTSWSYCVFSTKSGRPPHIWQ